MNTNQSIAEELSSALWNVSALRHGMFTPPQFRELCESTILRKLNEQPSLLPSEPDEVRAMRNHLNECIEALKPFANTIGSHRYISKQEAETALKAIQS